MMVQFSGIFDVPVSPDNADGFLNVPEEATPETQLLVEVPSHAVKFTSIALNEEQFLNIS